MYRMRRADPSPTAVPHPDQMLGVPAEWVKPWVLAGPGTQLHVGDDASCTTGEGVVDG